MSSAIAVHHGAFGRAVLYRLNRPIKLHAHREGHLIFHLGGPMAWARTGRGAALLSPGRGASINPWEPHEFIPGDRHDGTQLLVLYVTPSWFGDYGGSRDGILQFGRYEFEYTPPTFMMMEALRLALAGIEPCSCLDTLIFDLTAASYRHSWEGLTMPGRDGRVLGDYRIRRAIHAINTRIGQEVQFDDIAREAGLSRPHFFKLFREQLGVTPHLYLDTLRMERAIDRLTRSEDPVIDIGLSVGFESHSGFSRFFAAHVGVAPMEYRRVAVAS
jgi:AraC-like DNA-binding protein